MAKKIYIRYGHEILKNGSCTAASGILEEYDIINAYGPKVKDALVKAGYSVMTGGHTNKVYSTSADALYGEIKKANDWKADFFISFHANSGGGTGTEVFYYSTSTAGKKMATSISKEVSEALGLRNRGAKEGDGYAEIRKTTMPAVIVEPLFVDTEKDCAAYKAKGASAIANAIIKAIKANI